MAVILNSSLSSTTWTIEPGVCVTAEDEARLLDSGAARPLTEADKPEKAFDLDEGVWKLYKADRKKKDAE